MILTGSWDKTARLWDTATARPIGPPLQHDDAVESVAFSPTGKTILTGSRDKTARLWDPATGKPMGMPLLHEDAVWLVAFGPDSRSILTVSLRGTAQLWDVVTGRPIGPPILHQDVDRLPVVYSPDGKIVLTGNDDKTARLWDAVSAVPIGPPIVHQDRIGKVAFSPDSRVFLTSSRMTARLWDVNLKPIGQAMFHQALITSTVFSPDGRTVWTGSWDGTAQVWDAATGLSVSPPLEHGGEVRALALSPDGRTVVTGSREGTARLWDVATMRSIGPTLLLQGWVSRIQFSRDGKTFFTDTQFPRETRVWHVPAQVDDDLPRVQAWVETITGLQVDGQGIVRSLDPRAWRARWEQLRELGGPPKMDSGWLVDPVLYGAEPTARAQQFIRRERWSEAEMAFNEAIAARPHNGYISQDRTWLRIRRNLASSRPEAGRGEIDSAVIESPGDLWLRRRQILSRLASGDRDGLIQARANLLDRFSGVDSGSDANEVAWACCLVPDVNDRLDVVVRLAEWAVRDASVRDGSTLNTLGAALFRAGRFQDAIGCLDLGGRARRGVEEPLDWPFLAMAHHHLGRRDEARRWLDRLRNHQPSDDPNKFWDELEIRLLRSEAEAVILYDPVFPADPFAH
jgi:hypothetical protein